MNTLGIYIHVPFCNKKCPYCDFYSILASNDIMDQYEKRLIEELTIKSNSFNKYIVDTIYFGGGTPSLLLEKRLVNILEAIKGCFNLDNPEITLEVNPTKSDILNFEILNKHGVNRLSIGLQSANDDELKLLGRMHLAQDAKNTINMAKTAGINNISLDLMIATPSQTKSSLLRSIQFCVNQDVDHISAYLLKIEKGTVYYNRRRSLILPDEDTVSDLYISTVNELEKAGFNQYEISNFSKTRMESKHNLKYWNSDDYLGIGPAAHSFVSNKRFYYADSLESFLKGDAPINDQDGGTIEEYAMLKLRLRKGLCETEFQHRFNLPIPDRFYDNAMLFKDTNLVNVEKNRISFTTDGFLVSNQLIYNIIR